MKPTADGEGLLRARDLHKGFGGVPVVKGASLDVGSGEIVGLLGPNGAGKTTCFYMITGLIRPDSGQILLGDTDLTHLPVHRRARAGLGYLSQEPSVFRRLTVAENLMVALEQQPLNRSQRRQRLEMLLEEHGLEDIRDRPAQVLSGGQRRRAEIARMLAGEPDILLMDEPFAGIDPVSIQGLKEQIIALRDRGLGVLITDHNVRDTIDICNRSYILIEGRVIASGNAEHIMENQLVRDKYLGDTFEL